MSLAAVKLDAHRVSEFVDGGDELGRDVDVLDQLVAAVLAFDRAEGVDHLLDAGRDLGDLAAHVTEPGRQCVGPPCEPVKIVHVAGDHRRPVGQPITDEAGLVGGPELLRHHAQGPGDAADHRDIRQLS